MILKRGSSEPNCWQVTNTLPLLVIDVLPQLLGVPLNIQLSAGALEPTELLALERLLELLELAGVPQAVVRAVT